MQSSPSPGATGSAPPTQPIETIELFFGELNIEYGAQDAELALALSGDAGNEGPANSSELPLGVGTKEQLIAWARALRGDFPDTEMIAGVWIHILPTQNGRVPWEEGDALIGRILLLEGEVPSYVLEEDDVIIERVTNRISH